MNPKVISAIFKRDFVSYFSNPTGYVFICVFVMLSSLAAFWPPEFFANNLANLDQLSTWMPFILVIFIPAITMSVWAEERRQGTDELLLTLPASDFDVVLGKFKAGVAIFTVALLFSMFSIWLVFAWGLGSPDLGLFASTYLGYWFMGITLLSIGMVASFLTSNLTVGFVLGVLFSAPIALLGVADWVVKDPVLAERVREYSAVEQFGNFARGVLSLAPMSYFVGIAVAMLYVCMVLIGRRHWSGDDSSESIGLHFLARAVAIVVIAIGLNSILSNNDVVRADLTSEKLNSLAPSTEQLVKDLAADEELNPIRVDAYVSPQMPAEYAGQKRELLSTLEELASISGGRIQVVKHEIETFSREATLAEQTYGIEPREVDTKSRGARSRKSVFLGAAFSCGLDKVVIPFLDKGIPVEYELVRSITTVAQQKRKRVGVLQTDVQLSGGFSMQGPSPESQLITELKKQYDVTEVDPANAITERFDVLLAVQPSSLSPEAMDNFVAAVKSGQPTAIFEDPFPIPSFYPNVPGTAQPKQRGGGGMMGMFGGGGPPEPKGDISQLWRLLGVQMDGNSLVWQRYQPYPQAGSFTDDNWVFVDADNGAAEPLSQTSPITAGMQQVLFLYSGAIDSAPGARTEMLPLAVTGAQSGSISVSAVRSPTAAFSRIGTGRAYVLAAKITGEPPEEIDASLDESVSDEELREELASADEPADGDSGSGDADGSAAEDEAAKLNVVLVADIDLLADPFFSIRAIGSDSDALVDWRFQNVAFALNVLDELAGDDRFLAVRKRTREYSQLTRIADATEEFRDENLKERKKFIDEATAEIDKARQEFREKIAEVENRTDLNPLEKERLLVEEELRQQRIRDVKIAKLEKDRDRAIELSERELDLQIKGVQDRYKMAAVLLPPVLPVMLALLVYFHRRGLEKEGVSKQRLRFGSGDEPAASDAA
ncbi:MAG: Gldg family protein [Planctomycetota bacterium]